MTSRFKRPPKAAPDVVGIVREQITEFLLNRARRPLQDDYRLDYIGVGRGERIAIAALCADELRNEGHTIVPGRVAGVPSAGDSLTLRELVRAIEQSIQPEEQP